jgi:hypothetical protein
MARLWAYFHAVNVHGAPPRWTLTVVGRENVPFASNDWPS